MACPTCPQSGWPPASARVRPPDTRLDTVSVDQFLLRTPGSGWPADGHGGPLDRPAGRTPQFKVTASPMGRGPVRRATAKRRTSPALSVRPAACPSGHGQPRGLHVLALTGQDGNAHAPFGQPQPLPASGPARHDLHPCSMPERPQAWSPSDIRAVVSGVHDGRHDRTAFRTPHARSHLAGHRPLHPARHPNRKRRGQGTDERHSRHSDILDRHDHEDSRPGRRTPPLGPALRLGNQDRLGDGNTASATVTTAATR